LLLGVVISIPAQPEDIKFYNKQICQIGNITLITPDIFSYIHC
jgi:hypothetical protein